MAYRLVENKGDSVAVPQLVIAKLPELEDDWLRVALFVVATGETDPARIAAALRLKSPERAQTALVYWKGAGLLESCGEPQARGGIDAAPAPRAHLTTPEVASAAQGDPAIAGLVQECQALMGGVITQADTNILVSMYLSDGMPVDMILLGGPILPRWASAAPGTSSRVRCWAGSGRVSIPGEAAERLSASAGPTRGPRKKKTAKLLGLADAKFTKADSRAIADWYESYGYGPDMIAEAAAYAGEKKSVKYVNGILRAWYTKGYKTVRDVMAESAMGSSNVQAAAPAVKHNILDGGLRRALRKAGHAAGRETQ